MKSRFASNLLIRALFPAALLLAFACPARTAAQTATGQDHVVSSQALQQQVQTSSADRQKNIETLKNILETPTAKKAMQDAKVDPTQVKKAIPTLSDEELSNLAGRVNKAQHDFSAGFIGPGLFTILILLVILIIIIIVIH